MDYIQTTDSETWMPWTAEGQDWSWTDQTAGGSGGVTIASGDAVIPQQTSSSTVAADEYTTSYSDYYSNDRDTYGSTSGQVKQYEEGTGNDVHYGYVQMRDILPLPSAPIPYEPLATPSMGISPQMIMGNRVNSEQPITLDSPSPPITMSPVQPENEFPQGSPLENLLPPGVESPMSSLKSIGKRPAKFEIVLPGPRPLKTLRNVDGSIRTRRPDSSSIKAFESTPLKRESFSEPHKLNGSSSSRPPSSSSSSRSTASTTAASRAAASNSSRKPVPPIVDPFEPIRFPFIRNLIQPSIIRNARPGALFKYLRPRIIDGEDTPAQFTPHANELREMLLRLNEAASPAYLREMADNRKYSEVIFGWVKSMQREPAQWEPAIAPMFRLLARTDMPVNYLTELKIARIANKVGEKVAELDLASNADVQSALQAYNAWINGRLLSANRNVSEPASDPAAKKRKIEEGTDVKPVVPGKGEPVRAPTSSAKPTSSAPGKPTPKPKAVSADMSFFPPASSSSTQPKPRAKMALPDIKKRDPSSSAASPPIPTASTSSLLASTLSALNKPLAQSRFVKPKPELALETGPSRLGEEKKQGPNKKGHMVRWKDAIAGAGPLEDVLEFSQTAEELEVPEWQIENDLHGASAHQLDVDEGHLLRSSKSEDEEINWSEPPLYEGARDVPPITPEATVQAAREFGILAHPIGEPSEPSEAGVRNVYAAPDVRIYHPLAAVPSAITTLPIIAPPVPIAAPINNSLLSFLSGVVNSIPNQPLAQIPTTQQQYTYGYDYNTYPQQAPAQPQPPQDAYPYNNYPQATTSANPWPAAINHYPVQPTNPVLTPYPGGGPSQNRTYDDIVRSQGRTNSWGGGGRGNRKSKGGGRDRGDTTFRGPY